MEYKYYNQFNLTKELSDILSSIISKNENESYVCKVVNITIPEHDELVMMPSEPIDYFTLNDGVNGKQVIPIYEKKERYVSKEISEEEFNFLAIMKTEFYNKLLTQSFKNEEEIRTALKLLSIFYEEYSGVFDSRNLIQKFPYLQEFFNYLDKWRSDTGRVTLDNDVLDNGMKRTLQISNKK